jgi:hypothetical protein
MKGISLATLAASLVLAGFATAEDIPKPAKLDLKELHVYSYCGTEGKHLFGPKEKKIFDELKYSASSSQQTKFRISGKKRVDDYPYKGDYIYHLGKVVLTPIAQRSGTIVTEIDKDKDGAPSYYLVYELDDGTLKSQGFTLTKGPVYTWTMDRSGATATLTVKDGANVVGSMSAPTQNTREFGFASTVRFVGNVVDMTVTFD